MNGSERYGRKTPTRKAKCRIERRTVSLLPHPQVPGIRNVKLPEPSAPARWSGSLAIAALVLACIGGGIATAEWGLGVVIGVTSAVGLAMICFTMLATRLRGADHATDARRSSAVAARAAADRVASARAAPTLRGKHPTVAGR